MPLKKNKCTGWQVRGSLESRFTEVPGGPFLSLPPALYRSLSPLWTARSALPSDRLKNSADICVRVAKTQSKSRGKGQGGRSQSHNFRLCLFPLAWDLKFSLVLIFKRITHVEQNYYVFARQASVFKTKHPCQNIWSSKSMYQRLMLLYLYKIRTSRNQNHLWWRVLNKNQEIEPCLSFYISICF